jgi:hypothetical protein
VSHQVDKLGTTLSLAASVDVATYGQAVIFTATTGTAYGTPTGNVTFYADGISFGSSALNGAGHAGVNTTALSVGSHVVTATYGGDANYLPSFSAALGHQVNPAILTVTADNKTKIQGDPNPPLTYSITGFVNGETSAVVSGDAEMSTSATSESPVGTYPIVFTLSTFDAVNYAFTVADGTLTIIPNLSYVYLPLVLRR